VAQVLLQRGWTNVRPLLGGFDAWRKSSLAMEARATRRQTPSEVASNVAKAEGNEWGEN
jgi:3-mercaptopyruvate sulfurtransferase SseA